ncbi:hypothetical protein M0Q97_13295 [Candidatus Dojkabacteria bacterium]|jgi:hypothetical protein|nr:hypothetical protein [Candidatus Dojkabacteria bacterium]
MKNIKSINDFLNENIDDSMLPSNLENDENITIDITKINKKQYFVNYQITVDGDIIEIEGKLTQYDSGRAKEFKFEPDYLENVEEYYDENWEKIEDEILAYFWENKQEIDSK